MSEEATTPDGQTVTATSDNKSTIAVKVYSPFKVYFEGEAYSLSAVNATGPFDILPGHRNFLCMLVPCTLKVKSAKGTKSVKISHALTYIKSQKVTVFVDV